MFDEHLLVVIDKFLIVYIDEKGDTNEERKCRSKGICY